MIYKQEPTPTMIPDEIKGFIFYANMEKSLYLQLPYSNCRGKNFIISKKCLMRAPGYLKMENQNLSVFDELPEETCFAIKGLSTGTWEIL